MKTGHYQSQASGRPNWIVLLLLILIVLVGILIILLLRPAPVEVSTPDGVSQQTGPVEKNNGTISIPGYESITLKAGQTQQTVGLPNPAKNNCYFRISLLLEDGTLLWQSGLVKPGEISDPIVLSQPLEAGSYPNATMKYDCYTMDGNMTPLNSAATRLTIRVE